MNTQNLREWKVICWNVRGLNADRKWNSIRNKIIESACDVICVQETKTDVSDQAFIRQFCPPAFDAFLFYPSIGASGGIITIWKSSLLDGQLAFQNEFLVSVSFTFKFYDDEWLLTNIYGPSRHEGKCNFAEWLKHIQMPDHVTGS